MALAPAPLGPSPLRWGRRAAPAAARPPVISRRPKAPPCPRTAAISPWRPLACPRLVLPPPACAYPAPAFFPESSPPDHSSHMWSMSMALTGFQLDLANGGALPPFSAIHPSTNLTVRASDGYPLPTASRPPCLLAILATSRSRVTFATMDAAATTSNRESALWCEPHIIPSRAACARGSLGRLSSQRPAPSGLDVEFELVALRPAAVLAHS